MCHGSTSLYRLEVESAKYAGYSEFVEQVFGNVERLTDHFGRFTEMPVEPPHEEDLQGGYADEDGCS